MKVQLTVRIICELVVCDAAGGRSMVPINRACKRCFVHVAAVLRSFGKSWTATESEQRQELKFSLRRYVSVGWLMLIVNFA